MTTYEMEMREIAQRLSTRRLRLLVNRARKEMRRNEKMVRIPMKIQTGLRVPQTRYDEIKEMAERTGISVNALMLYLIDLGVTVVNLGIKEADRCEIHNQRHNCEL